MPADRRATFPTVKPVKTERTHEENQERAYIAASRRSDRSLEARIESARRASEIHKKRTGRALRVTEQDVVNEEMYEEEDDDLPTQYQRLNAHLQTSSWLFNRKLHDYIATQHGVRNMFMHQQFPGHNFQPYGPPSQPNGGQPLINQSMAPPQPFSPATQGFIQPSQAFGPQGFQQPQQQGYRHTPYNIPQRQHSHQRSSSMSTPLAMPNFGVAGPQASPSVSSPQAEGSRRMSLPPQAFEQASHPGNDGTSRPALSRSPTSQSVQQQPVSPIGHAHTSSKASSGQGTPPLKSEHNTPTHYGFPSLPFNANSQVIDMNPLSMSLPPEAQQLVGSALDPNDPRTSILMAGSDNLPQPFVGTYTYNPNLSPKGSRMNNSADQSSLSAGMPGAGMTQTLAPEHSIKVEPSLDSSTSTTPPSAMTDNLFGSQSLFTPTGFEYSNFFDQYHPSESRISNDGLLEPFEENSFVNWD